MWGLYVVVKVDLYGVATISIGSLKLWVFVAEYPLFYKSLLQKGPTILRSLQVAAIP